VSARPHAHAHASFHSSRQACFCHLNRFATRRLARHNNPSTCVFPNQTNLFSSVLHIQTFQSPFLRIVQSSMLSLLLPCPACHACHAIMFQHSTVHPTVSSCASQPFLASSILGVVTSALLAPQPKTKRDVLYPLSVTCYLLPVTVCTPAHPIAIIIRTQCDSDDRYWGDIPGESVDL